MSGPIDLPRMLAARDRRAGWQRELLERYRLPLVSFTMNIAGPVKNSPAIRRGFRLGRELLLGQLAREKAAVVATREVDEDTGCEGLYVVEMDPRSLKAITCQIEDGTPLGRLLDLDVLAPGGEKLDRPEPRRCLICGGPARECARSRAHPVPELQRETRRLLEEAVTQWDAETAATLAVRALLHEVCTTPKPGLVDRANNGSHRDMDIFTFMDSSAGLWPYFAQCVRAGRETACRPAPETFAALRWPGKLAEGRMLAATGGVNTHKGAIFSLGLACGALGRLDREDWAEPERVLAQVAAMTAGSVERELAGAAGKPASTAGEDLYRRYGVTGVRGQAEAGFPAVRDHGLPVLERGIREGRTPEQAGTAALLALLAHTDDTNMIARGGIQVQKREAARLRELLAEQPYPAAETIAALDAGYIRQNLSPGGSADLLALCYLLHSLKKTSGND